MTFEKALIKCKQGKIITINTPECNTKFKMVADGIQMFDEDRDLNAIFTDKMILSNQWIIL